MLCIEAGKHLFQLGMVFLNAGADLRLQDAQGMTALHHAASTGSLNILFNMLQLCDAELVDKPNKVGSRDRMLCFVDGRLTRSMLALLCAQFGETIAQLAVLRDQPMVLDLIENWRSGNPVSLAGERESGDDDDDTDDIENDRDDDDAESD